MLKIGKVANAVPELRNTLIGEILTAMDEEFTQPEDIPPLDPKNPPSGMTIITELNRYEKAILMVRRTIVPEYEKANAAFDNICGTTTINEIGFMKKRKDELEQTLRALHLLLTTSINVRLENIMRHDTESAIALHDCGYAVKIAPSRVCPDCGKDHGASTSLISLLFGIGKDEEKDDDPLN